MDRSENCQMAVANVLTSHRYINCHWTRVCWCSHIAVRSSFFSSLLSRHLLFVSIQDPRFPEDGVVEVLFSERDPSLASGILTFLCNGRCFLGLCEFVWSNMAGLGINTFSYKLSHCFSISRRWLREEQFSRCHWKWPSGFTTGSMGLQWTFYSSR